MDGLTDGQTDHAHHFVMHATPTEVGGIIMVLVVKIIVISCDSRNVIMLHLDLFMFTSL